MTYPACMVQSLFRGLSFFRWAAWVWMAVLLAANHGALTLPWLAWGLVGAAFAVTAWLTVIANTGSGRTPPVALAVEVAVALALVVCDGLVFGSGHAFGDGESLNGIWQLAAIIDVGICLGMWAGLAVGPVMALAHYGAVALNGVDMTQQRVVAILANGVVSGLAGLTAGYVSRLVTDAEDRVAMAKAREEVARTLHDGVLQTLAVVERRSDDPDLAALARSQERELRDYLFGVDRRADLAADLRRVTSRFERAFETSVVLLVPDDVPDLGDTRQAALTAAVGEALNNAGKHGAARAVTVYAEPDGAGGLFCSVKDDGAGFDPSVARGGVGLRSSIKGRIEEQGGRVEIDSAPGRGTEVRMWLPR